MKSLSYLLGLVVFHLLATVPVARSSQLILGESNKDILVGLRIEGASHTLYEGQIKTHGHNVTTSSGGTHPCDGTKPGKKGSPSATPTSALDDAAHKNGFTWDGKYYPKYDDFLISRIGKEQPFQDKFWLLLVNFKPPEKGGCQQKVNQHDDVLWAVVGDYNDVPLKLSGPKTARTGHPFTVVVTDGKTGQPAAGARVAGISTGFDGKASLIFKQSGSQHLKAERAQSIRSNTLEVEVGP